MTSDRQLLQRVASGDESALGEVYDRFGPLTYSMVLRLVGVAEDAEEVTADVFAQIWRSAHTFEADRGSVPAWIVSMARSRALDRLRSRRRSSAVVERAAAVGADAVSISSAVSEPADQLAELRETSTAVGGALAALTSAQRRVIELAYFEGLSQSEIAARLSEPLGTVKTRMRTAMLKLKELLAASIQAGAI